MTPLGLPGVFSPRYVFVLLAASCVWALGIVPCAQAETFASYLASRGAFPTLAGDTFVIYKSPIGVTDPINCSGFSVDGRITVRNPALFFPPDRRDRGNSTEIGVRSKALYVQNGDRSKNVLIGRHSTSGLILPAELFPALQSSFGQNQAASAGIDRNEYFGGGLDVIKPSFVPSGAPVGTQSHPNSLWQRQVKEASAGHAPLLIVDESFSGSNRTDPCWIEDQSNSPQYPPPGFPAGYDRFRVLYVNLNHRRLPNMRILPVVDQVVLLGQSSSGQYNAAGELTARSLLFVPAEKQFFFTLIQDIRLVGENNRPLVLGFKSKLPTSALGLYWQGPVVNNVDTAVHWRSILINEGHYITFYRPRWYSSSPGPVVLAGGVLTNWSINRAGADRNAYGTFVVKQDPLAARAATRAAYDLAALLPTEVISPIP